MRKRIYLLWLLVLTVFSVNAQEYKFKHIGKEKGLSQSRVNTILEDHDGFIWFGTDDGLNKYNGKEITVFKNDARDDKTISDNWIHVLYEDDEHQLWIGTLEGGLNKFNKYNNTFTTYKHNPGDEHSLSSDNVQCIARHDVHSFWVGTDDGLNLFDTRTGKFTRFKDEDINPQNPGSVMKNDNVRCLLLDKNGILWIGTNKSGLYSYNAEKKQFTEHNLLNEANEFVITNHNRVRTIFEDSDQRLWIGYDGGYLSQYNRKTNQYKYYISEEGNPKSISNKLITSIMEDHKGQLWVGTADGINLYDPVNDNFRVVRAIDKNPYSLQDNFSRVIYEDRANSVWIGTDSYGVTVFHRSTGKFNHISKDSYDAVGLQSNIIFCFAEGAVNEIWIGTVGKGLAVYNRKANNFTHYLREENNTHDKILCIEKVGKRMWFGTWGGGLNYYDLDKKQFNKKPIQVETYEKLSNNNVLDIIADEKGNLWIATLNGLNYYDVANDSIAVYTTDEDLPYSSLYCLDITENGRLWIGTNGGGLLQFNPESGKFKQWMKGGKNSVSNNTIHCIANDGKGNLWLGTKNGLSKFDIRKETFTNYTEADGLSNSFIVGILFDNIGNLWISTYNGLTKFNPASKKSETHENRKFYSIDGLQGDEFNQNAFFKTSKGEFFFGGTEGFNHFFPNDIVDNPYIPPVVLTSFKVAGKEYQLDTSVTYISFIELSYRDNFFSFEFASLDYVLPEKIMYSYKMEGLDEEWSVPSNRSYASYTDLQGGDYIFRVKATNNDGVWNEKGIEIKIRIIPPFYKTNLFYTLCVFFTILLVFVFIRVRIASIKKEKKKLEEQVAMRTRELAEKNRDIMSSIEYAKRIQEAILPDRLNIFSHLPESFILYRPKDIVSGDFYWFGVVGSKKIIAAVDCTGHGVPGAFMSMIGHNILNQIILEKKITDPATVLSLLRTAVRSALKQEISQIETSDGMDIALCVIDSETHEFEFSGAFRPVVIIRNGSIEKIDGTKSPIGGKKGNAEEQYITHKRTLHKGDSFYMYSDGFVDQFGGTQGKKFMGKNLHALLLQIQSKSMTEQNFILMEAFEKWTGTLEQVDDVLVIGVRV